MTNFANSVDAYAELGIDTQLLIERRSELVGLLRTVNDRNITEGRIDARHKLMSLLKDVCRQQDDLTELVLGLSQAEYEQYVDETFGVHADLPSQIIESIEGVVAEVLVANFGEVTSSESDLESKVATVELPVEKDLQAAQPVVNTPKMVTLAKPVKSKLELGLEALSPEDHLPFQEFYAKLTKTQHRKLSPDQLVYAFGCQRDPELKAAFINSRREQAKEALSAELIVLEQLFKGLAQSGADISRVDFGKMFVAFVNKISASRRSLADTILINEIVTGEDEAFFDSKFNTELKSYIHLRLPLVYKQILESQSYRVVLVLPSFNEVERVASLMIDGIGRKTFRTVGAYNAYKDYVSQKPVIYKPEQVAAYYLDSVKGLLES